MKALLIVLAVLLTGPLVLKAQKVVPPIQPILKGSGRVQLNFTTHLTTVDIVRSHNKEYRADSLYFKSIKWNWLRSFSLLNDSVSVKKYGNPTGNGVLIVTLNDDEHPEAFINLKKHLKAF
ncbi:hypothetical protein [Mucilaginibacter gracilis]|nr:hypothetical protein [Mucilaginibacter gracilis]